MIRNDVLIAIFLSMLSALPAIGSDKTTPSQRAAGINGLLGLDRKFDDKRESHQLPPEIRKMIKQTYINETYSLEHIKASKKIIDDIAFTINNYPINNYSTEISLGDVLVLNEQQIRGLKKLYWTKQIPTENTYQKLSSSDLQDVLTVPKHIRLKFSRQINNPFLYAMVQESPESLEQRKQKLQHQETRLQLLNTLHSLRSAGAHGGLGGIGLFCTIKALSEQNTLNPKELAIAGIIGCTAGLCVQGLRIANDWNEQIPPRKQPIKPHYTKTSLLFGESLLSEDNHHDHTLKISASSYNENKMTWNPITPERE